MSYWCGSGLRCQGVWVCVKQALHHSQQMLLVSAQLVISPCGHRRAAFQFHQIGVFFRVQSPRIALIHDGQVLTFSEAVFFIYCVFLKFSPVILELIYICYNHRSTLPAPCAVLIYLFSSLSEHKRCDLNQCCGVCSSVFTYAAAWSLPPFSFRGAIKVINELFLDCSQAISDYSRSLVTNWKVHPVSW